ncbi:MAG TPA: MBL fold metallo-hydrolase [Burkholderiaceae bacterium]|jgi:glyoxylase-like metal-dependent hydrolase (beta-lactamase superfamily II)|nr:MBL fold metallo-hydrolase [Burkholderiaceae bacterium]
MKARVEGFFDPTTWTVTYLVYDRPGGNAAIIDPVLDYDPKSGRTSTRTVDPLIARASAQRLTVDWILETHAHADHLSAAPLVKRRIGGRIAIGERIDAVQRTFGTIFNLGADFRTDGTQFDHLFRDRDTFRIGELTVTALHVPGHTPADLAYLVGDDDAVFVGDTLFMPDVGTARADFPGGDARQLYRSLRALLALPAATRVFVCHDYPPAGREVQWETTVAEQRARNIHVHDGVSEDQFVQMREQRDRSLQMPVLILPSIQVNIRAGELPPPESNGVSYLKIPVNAL